MYGTNNQRFKDTFLRPESISIIVLSALSNNGPTQVVLNILTTVDFAMFYTYKQWETFSEACNILCVWFDDAFAFSFMIEAPYLVRMPMVQGFSQDRDDSAESSSFRLELEIATKRYRNTWLAETSPRRIKTVESLRINPNFYYFY